MRLVEYIDKGQKRKSWVKDSDPDDMARYGIPVAIPDVEGMDWEAIKREVVEALEGQELYDWRSVQQSQLGFTPALNVLKRHLNRLYRQGN